MKEFVEKLIGRLEEIYDRNDKAKKEAYKEQNWEYFDLFAHRNEGVYTSISIVNQLAEEYKDKVMINGQYCWQTCSATEHCKECNRLCNGSIDYYENYDVLAEEYNNDFCEWKFMKTVVAYFYSSGCNHKRFSDLHGFEFCPYCGKKIKVVK